MTHFDLSQVRKLSPEEGDVFCMPIDTPVDVAEDFANALHMAVPGVRCLVFIGPVQSLDPETMRAAGWARV